MNWPRPSRSWVAPVVAGAVVTAWLGIFVVMVRDYGWDDGAITEAYARTFVNTGRIALTPSSEVGEGFSSPAWFLLLSLVGVLARPFGGLGYIGFIAAGQWLAIASAALGAGLLTVLLRSRIGAPAGAATAIAAFAGAGMVNEAMNGMEMLLACTVAVAILLAVDRDTTTSRRWALAVAFALPFVRLEALTYLAVLGLFVVVWRFRTVLALALGSAAGLALVTVSRLIVFGEWLPNTMYAKLLSPYRQTAQANQGPGPGGGPPPDGSPPPGGGPGGGGPGDVTLTPQVDISSELLATWKPIAAVLVVACLVMAAVVVIALVRRRRLEWSDPPPIWTLAALGWALGCTVVNWQLGRNWGFVTRMELSMVPIGIGAAAVLGAVAVRSLLDLLDPSIKAPGARWAAPLVIALAAWLATSAQFGSLIMWQHNLLPALEHSEAQEISPHFYRGTATQVDRVRVMLGQDTLVYMVPDVGGSALCCTQLTIVDSALLTNPTLTKLGWGGFASYLESVSPDVIETHDLWSQVSGLYQVPYFNQNYRPIVIGDRFLWLRSDLLNQLGGRCAMQGPDQSARAWYRGDPVDERYLAQQQFRVCALS